MTGTKYLALGYPWRDASLDDLNQRVRAPMMPYIGRFAPAQKYEQLGFADYSHVLFEFDPREVYGLDGPREPSNPEGMSGGGLFRLDSLMGAADAKNPLVAIPIENRGRTHG